MSDRNSNADALKQAMTAMANRRSEAERAEVERKSQEYLREHRDDWRINPLPEVSRRPTDARNHHQRNNQ